MPRHFYVLVTMSASLLLLERTKVCLNCNVELLMSLAQIHLHMRKMTILTTYIICTDAEPIHLNSILHNSPNIAKVYKGRSFFVIKHLIQYTSI